MAFEFKLPEVSEGVESVDIAEILVAEGDLIVSGQAVVEVETDKAVAEIQCPHAGKVTKIHVSSGDAVTIGAVLLTLETSDASAASDSRSSSPSGAAAAVASASATAAAAESGLAASSPEQGADSGATKSETTSTGGGIITFGLPAVSEGVESVDIAEVLVAVGDTIAAGQAVCEVETEKAVAEIECPHAGTITEIHISTGDSIEIGSPLVTLQAASGVSSSSSASSPPSAKTVASSAKSSSGGASASASAATKPAQAPGGVRSNGASKLKSTAGSDQPPPPAGPATRRLARKLGVDLHKVKGTGTRGRITTEDVEGFVRTLITNGGGGASRSVMAAPALPDFSRFGAVRREALNKIARTSAANLSHAWTTIPHVTQHDLADVTDLEAARHRYVKSHPDSPKVTMTAIMIKAIVGALKAFPEFNASLDIDNGELVLKDYYHIGVAVDTPFGLVVPVIRDADQKNVLEVAAELTDLAGKARDRKLSLNDMQGASFTITNLGGIGGTAFTPIVNWPEVAILGMSRGRKELTLEDDIVVQRLMLPVSLSYDHRVVNGADAARFIVKLSGSLSNFFELF